MEESQEKVGNFRRCIQKITPQKVDAAQLALDRDVVDDELLIHNPVAEPHEPNHEMFASTAVAALPCQEQSPLAFAKDASAEVKDPPEGKCMLPDVDFAFSEVTVLYKASLKPMSSKLLFRL